MSKAEKFIQENTRYTYNYNSYAQDPEPWLTPDKARKAVEIAREETIKEVCEYLSKNYLIKTIEPLRWVSIDKVFDDLKKYLEDKV